MSGDYWLGVATLPALTAVLAGAFVAWIWITESLRKRGLTFEAKIRDTSPISDYTLRHNIWWERSFGPVFVGGWYREPPTVETPSDRLFTRWLGLGSANGPCVMGYWKRNLGAALPGDGGDAAAGEAG